MIRVAVVDDHPVARYGIEHMLGKEPGIVVAATASTAAEAAEAASAGVDVVLMDLYLEGERPSLPAVRELAAAVPVLVVSASVRPGDVVEAVRAGASGYVSKQAEAATFRTAVETVADGGFWLSSQLADVLRSHLAAGGEEASPSPGSEVAAGGLSPREDEVLSCIAQGFTHAQTARRLGISTATVDTYVERIRAKMHVGNKAELTRLALERRRGQKD